MGNDQKPGPHPENLLNPTTSIVCTLPSSTSPHPHIPPSCSLFFLLGEGSASDQIFKKGSLKGSQFLEGVCWERGGGGDDFFQEWLQFLHQK